MQEAQDTDYEEINVNSIRSRQANSIGSEYVVLIMLKKIGLEAFLKEVSFKENDFKIAEEKLKGLRHDQHNQVETCIYRRGEVVYLYSCSSLKKKKRCHIQFSSSPFRSRFKI